MERLTGSEAKSLMEAYQAVYASQELTEEQLWEEVEAWVNSLLEEGYDLSEYTWEEMYETYISEAGMDMFATPAMRDAKAKQAAQFYTGTKPSKPDYLKPAIAAGQTAAQNKAAENVFKLKQGSLSRPANSAASTRTAPATPAARPASPAPAAARPAAAPARPSAAPARPSAAPTKPATASAAPTKPAGSAMDQWAKENSKLAAASAEKARIRGTQQTDNPLMKDMRSRLPMNSPSVQSPDVAKLGKDGKGNQSLVSNPNAFKAATPTQAIKAAPSTSPVASGSVAPATAAIAAKTTQPPVAPRQTAREKVLNQSYEYDAFDLVLEYLTSEGHVGSIDEALYVMMEMDSETIQGICEAAADQSNKQIDKGVKTTYKAQNVIDNQHQGRSRGLNRLPAGERANKTKRMQGRLKARRDDLFGERNKREDSRRDELKKMLGL